MRAFWALFGIMAAYYGWRLFALTPWYDELYTYYCFISKGPVYAAIHWPLPNNHVGYSVLSACLDLLGNPYIGLRGVSYLCALANLFLLHKGAGRYFTGWVSFFLVGFYLSMNLVNQLAVQGRGYTMGITCLLTAFLCLVSICEEEKAGKKVYIIYVLALALGLYVVSSNVYWVVPLCLSGGIYLLAGAIREGRGSQRFFLKTGWGGRLVKLIGASLSAAFITVLLYATIWAAIGSNLLVKEAASIYYGMGHVKMILTSPFAALGRGMAYMLDTPYIQSEERAGFVGRLGEWLSSLAGYYYGSLQAVVLLLWAFGVVILIVKIIRNLQKEELGNTLLYLFLVLGTVLVPVILLIQCKRPYYRVFTYGGVLLALTLGVLLEGLLKGICKGIPQGRAQKWVVLAIVLLAVAFGIKCIGFSGYNVQYGLREHEIAAAFKEADVETRQNICVTDCNQEYLLYFYYGIRCENREIQGADMALLDKRMMDPDFDEMVWEFYHYYDTIPWDYVGREMDSVYENDDYVLFTKKTAEN